MGRFQTFLVLSGATILAACQTIPSIVEVPADFKAADTEKAEVEGLNGFRKSRYSVLGVSGEAWWTASSRGTGNGFGTLKRNRSTVDVIATMPGLEDLRADCMGEQESLEIEERREGWTLEIPIDDIALYCEVYGEEGSRGTIVLQQDDVRRGLTEGSGNTGQALIDNERWDIVSLHRIENFPTQIPEPLGHQMSRDGQTLAVLDQTDRRPSVVVRRDLSAEERQRAVLIGLVIFNWIDPRDDL